MFFRSSVMDGRIFFEMLKFQLVLGNSLVDGV